ncbi:MAG: gliding motility-associated C-terminal domain-containing protein [Flavobacteriales bacterium]|nr:gliding motility-associated C-terminal domain-containing protein [Flavobacteriales bacterium]
MASGAYNVTVTDVNQCQEVFTVDITEPQPIILSLTPSVTICIGQSTLLDTLSVSGGVSPYTFAWDTPVMSTNSFYNVSPIVTTKYGVAVLDANSCPVTDTVEITVNDPLVVSALAPPACEWQNASLSATGAGGDVTNYTFEWRDPVTKALLMSGPIQSVSGLSAPGTSYLLVLTDGCSDNDTITVVVTVNPVPPPPTGLRDTSYCVGETMVDIVAVGTDIKWYSDILLTPPPIGTGPTFTPSSTLGSTIYYATQTVAGCESLPAYATIQIDPPPVAGFFPSPKEAPITNPGIEFTDLATPDVGSWIVSWEWNYGDETGDTLYYNFFSSGDTSHVYTDTGTYVVYQIVTNNFGCQDIAYDTVVITNEYIIFPPNAFAPNGKNKYFLPMIIGTDEREFKFYVFDRWGDKIYEHIGTYTGWLGWDGRANDGLREAQQDVYVWMIYTEDLNGDAHEYVGHVTLLR